MTIDVVVNGESRALPQGQTLLELLHTLELDPARVALELNQRIVKQALWAETVVPAGAKIEIVQFVGGG